LIILVKVQFDIDSDLIDCSNDIYDNIEKYQTEFFKWLFDKNNEHKYWICKNGKKFGCCYRSDAFVEWLNKFVINDNTKKAKVVESYISIISKCDKIIYF